MTETWHAIPGGADERMRVGRIGHLIVAWRTKFEVYPPQFGGCLLRLLVQLTTRRHRAVQDVVGRARTQRRYVQHDTARRRDVGTPAR